MGRGATGELVRELKPTVFRELYVSFASPSLLDYKRFHDLDCGGPMRRVEGITTVVWRGSRRQVRGLVCVRCRMTLLCNGALHRLRDPERLP